MVGLGEKSFVGKGLALAVVVADVALLDDTLDTSLRAEGYVEGSAGADTVRLARSHAGDDGVGCAV